MKLFIFNAGDDSVGLNPIEYSVECPFERNEVEQNDLEYFRELQVNCFSEFLDLKVRGIYDFEFKEMY
jgi:hypothetical protein